LRIRRPLRVYGRRDASVVVVAMPGDANDKTSFSHKSCHRISEDSWRKSAREHSNRIRDILAPGLTPLDHPLNTGIRRQQRQRERKEQHRKRQDLGLATKDSSRSDTYPYDTITALDPKHPVYNFLIEYYGLKGTKGVRRLMKWPLGISSIAGAKGSGILLEGAIEQDFYMSLNPKGAALYDEDVGGIFLSPSSYVYGNQPNKFHHRVKDLQDRSDWKTKTELKTDQTKNHANDFPPPRFNGGPLAPFLWYRTLLQRTLEATPILHCYGLHEWAMQYQPKIFPEDKLSPPPSSKYQSHLKLRIDKKTLNETVEQNTLFCSHVDAWKFFAQEALPLNQFDKHSHESSSSKGLPSATERPEWLLRSEQPACVHTTMDLLKIAMKLGPFCEPDLFCRVLALAVDARSLDVAASPYDVQTDYGVDPIPIETPAGRNEYKHRQMELMKQANPIRRELLANYNQFLAAI